MVAVRKKSSTTCLICLFVAMTAAPLTAQQTRVWRDLSGEFEVRASLLRIDKEKETARLKLEGGVEIVVPIKFLSDDDRRWLKTLTDQPAPSSANPAAAASPGDAITFLCWRRDGQDYAVPGLVVRGDGTSSLVVAPSGVDENLAPTSDELLLSWNVWRERRSVPGTIILRDKRGWIARGPVEQLPAALPTSTPEVMREGLPVIVDGYALERRGGVYLFARIRATAVVEQLARDEAGNLLSILLAGDDLAALSVGIVATAEGQPVACLTPQLGLRVITANTNQIRAYPLERAESLRELVSGSKSQGR